MKQFIPSLTDGDIADPSAELGLKPDDFVPGHSEVVKLTARGRPHQVHSVNK